MCVSLAQALEVQTNRWKCRPGRSSQGKSKVSFAQFAPVFTPYEPLFCWGFRTDRGPVPNVSGTLRPDGGLETFGPSPLGSG